MLPVLPRGARSRETLTSLTGVWPASPLDTRRAWEPGAATSLCRPGERTPSGRQPGEAMMVARRRRYHHVEGQLSFDDLGEQAGEGDGGEPLRGDGPRSLATVAAAEVPGDTGSGQLLLGPWPGSGHADRGPDPGPGAGRPSGGGLPGEGGSAQRGTQPGGGDRAAGTGPAAAGTGSQRGHGGPDPGGSADGGAAGGAPGPA